MTSTTGRSSRKRDPGFTLLELIMVMVIVCIALAIAAPSLRDFWRGSQTRNHALQILALTRWARSEAETSATILCLRFDVGEGTYRLETWGILGAAPVTSEFGRTFELPEGCTVQVLVAPGAEPNCIRFYPDGRTDGVRILLQGQGDDQDLTVRSPTEDFELRGGEEEVGR
jgi:prepilin-type N-terminal cleavage/methylation domain-containing protein